MIPLISYAERRGDFSGDSLQWRLADSSDIRARLGRAFDAKNVRFLGSGYNNAHHLLDATGGRDRLVVRRCLIPVEVMHVRIGREFRVLDHLSSHAFQHSPQPVRTLKQGEIDACPGYAMTYARGENGALNETLIRELGAVAARLHRIPVPDWLASSQVSVNPLRILASIFAEWDRNYATVAAGLPDPVAERYHLLRSELPQVVQDLDWDGDLPCLLHGDLGEHNFVKSGRKLTLIDWEFAAVSAPVMDFLWLFARDGVGSRYQEAFYDGYEDEMGSAIPIRWLRQSEALRLVALVELVLWAQSGIDDICQGRNPHFLNSNHLVFLQRQVRRVEEADGWLRSRGYRLKSS